MEMELVQIICLVPDRDRVVMGRTSVRSPVHLDRVTGPVGDGVLDGLVIKDQGPLYALGDGSDSIIVEVDGRLMHTRVTEVIGWVEESPVSLSSSIRIVLFQ